MTTTNELSRDYISPTKESPVFIADDDTYGFIDLGVYKNSLCGRSTTPTFALSYENGIERLHNYIKNTRHIDPKAKFTLYIMDGSVDKSGQSKLTKVYSLTYKNAKRFMLCSE